MNVNVIAEQYRAWHAKYVNAPECSGPAFNEWKCCDYHRDLLAESKSLTLQAEKLEIKSKSQTFSANWWRDVGVPFMYDLLARRQK